MFQVNIKLTKFPFPRDKGGLVVPVRVMTWETDPSLLVATHRYWPTLFPSMLRTVRLCRPARWLIRTLFVLRSMMVLFLYQVREGLGTPVTLQTSSSSCPLVVCMVLSLTVRLGLYDMIDN